MKFAKLLFNIAGVYGVLMLTPLYFLFDRIGVDDPPPITHPAFYYGFAGVGLAWQFAFFIIARDPSRYRLMMIPSMLEKLGYGLAVVALVMQGRTNPRDLVFGAIDLVMCALFLVAFLRTPRRE